MHKHEKFLSFLLIVSLVLVFYLALTSKSINLKNNNPNTGEQDIITSEPVKTEMVDNYRDQTKKIVDQYELLMDNIPDSKLNEFLSLENRLLGIAVPKEYKNLHINLLYALINTEDYIKDNRTESLDSSRNIIDGIKQEYKWLD